MSREDYERVRAGILSSLKATYAALQRCQPEQTKQRESLEKRLSAHKRRLQEWDSQFEAERTIER